MIRKCKTTDTEDSSVKITREKLWQETVKTL